MIQQEEQKTEKQNQDIIQIKGSIFTLLVIYIKQIDLKLIRQALTDHFQKHPDFFENAPIVLDLGSLENHSDQIVIDLNWFSEITQVIRSNGLVVVGIRNALTSHEALASQIGLGIMPRVEEINKINNKKSDKKDESEEVAIESKIEVIQDDLNAGYIVPKEAELYVSELDSSSILNTDESIVSSASKVKIIRHPVRSGQCIRAKNADLIILAPVSSGAEIIADGHIHVYAPLRGRALAGASGDTSARIFIHKMEAQLVSIAGYYKVIEEIELSAYGKPSQVYLDGEKLIIEALIK